MPRYIRSLAVALSLFALKVLSDSLEDLSARGDAPMNALRHESGQSAQSPMADLLDGRSLLDSWLGRRQSCLAGYSDCSSKLPLRTP